MRIGKYGKYKVQSHGMGYIATNRPYRIWAGMKARCSNQSNYMYGGKGIKVCERWQKFENFWEDMKSGYSDKLSLDRIDSKGNYEPNNCRWVTSSVQAFNKGFRKDARLLKFRGEVKTLAMWARELGIKHGTLHARIVIYGWTIEKALSKKEILL